MNSAQAIRPLLVLLLAIVGVQILRTFGPAAGVRVLNPKSDAELKSPIKIVADEQLAELADKHLSVILKPRNLVDFPDHLALDFGAGKRTLSVDYTGQFTAKVNLLVTQLPIYTIASYLENPPAGDGVAVLDSMLNDGASKVFLIRFDRNVTGSQMRSAIQDQIRLSFHDVDKIKLKPAIDHFLDQFSQSARPGDVVLLAWLKEGEFYCSFNQLDRVKRVVQDIPMSRAIWRIWVGDTCMNRLELVKRVTLPPPKLSN